MNIVLMNKIEDSIIESLEDGEGVRLVLFLCGCSHHCRGCHNPRSWDIQNGKRYAIDEVVDVLYGRLKEGYYSGLTLSGGDPFYQEEAVLELVKRLKNELNPLNIWCYTGYHYEQLQGKELLNYVDVLVDGPFQLDKKYPRKSFRGSNNQRLIVLKDGCAEQFH